MSQAERGKNSWIWIKNFRGSRAILLALATSSLLAAGAPASAQYFERDIFEAPPRRLYRAPPPGASEIIIEERLSPARRGGVPVSVVSDILYARGYELVERPLWSGDKIIALGENVRGGRARFVIDAFSGRLLRIARLRSNGFVDRPPRGDRYFDGDFAGSEPRLRGRGGYYGRFDDNRWDDFAPPQGQMRGQRAPRSGSDAPGFGGGANGHGSRETRDFRGDGDRHSPPTVRGPHTPLTPTPPTPGPVVTNPTGAPTLNQPQTGRPGQGRPKPDGDLSPSRPQTQPPGPLLQNPQPQGPLTQPRPQTQPPGPPTGATTGTPPAPGAGQAPPTRANGDIGPRIQPVAPPPTAAPPVASPPTPTIVPPAANPAAGQSPTPPMTAPH